VKLTERQLERILNDKNYWATIAAEIIAEASQNVSRGPSDSGIAEIGASPLPLGRILESHSLQRTRVRFPLPGSGPRSIPMIAEATTLSSAGVVISQRRAERLKAEWNLGRLRAQEKAQKQAEGGSVGMDHPSMSCRQAHPDETHDEFLIRTHGEEEEASDHPGQNCGDAHPDMSHDDFLDQQEEEEEEHRNPLYRQNSAGARSISTSRHTRER
jgi:hypothetical protein